jgi:tellurite resistance protein TerC
MDMMGVVWLGMPVWIWLAFLLAVLAILAFDLGVMHRDSHEIGVPESLKMSALYIGLGLAWAAVVYGIYPNAGAMYPQMAAATSSDERAWTAVKLYMTGYLVEKTLAMDNVFIISLLIRH